MKNLLQKKFENKQLILASGSPRRYELMKGLDVDFMVKTKEVNEIYPSNLKKEEITAYLAELKANAFDTLSENEIVITADTIVCYDNKVLMKPKDNEDAIEILKHLSGQKHEVYTSVCIRSTHKFLVFSDMTKVYFKPFDIQEIEYYISKYKPYDKAGAYGVQEWLGYIGIDRIEGSYYNVMGLPVHKLYQALKEF